MPRKLKIWDYQSDVINTYMDIVPSVARPNKPSRINMPGGSYKDIVFPSSCRFNKRSRFTGCTFASKAVFGPRTEFYGISHLGDICLLKTGCLINGFIRMGLSCRIESDVKLPAASLIGKGAFFDNGCTIGARSTIGRDSSLLNDITIGDECIIQDNVSFGKNAKFGANVSFGRNLIFEEGTTFENGLAVNDIGRPYLQIGPLGSSSHTITIFDFVSGPMVRAGEYFNTLDDFIYATRKTAETPDEAEEWELALRFAKLCLASRLRKTEQADSDPPAAEQQTETTQTTQTTIPSVTKD